jgi:hypothetical protein
MPNVMKIWEPKPPGTLWSSPGLLGDCFTFTFINSDYVGCLFHRVPKATSWNVKAHAGFLCDKDAVVRDTIKGKILHIVFCDKRRVNNEVIRWVISFSDLT